MATFGGAREYNVTVNKCNQCPGLPVHASFLRHTICLREENVFLVCLTEADEIPAEELAECRY